jgi:transposase InsO family protein
VIFKATGPDQKWCADITYVKTREGYLVLAVVTDVYSRRIVGWSMRDNLAAAPNSRPRKTLGWTTPAGRDPSLRSRLAQYTSMRHLQ